jgi:hypothetical protein
LLKGGGNPLPLIYQFAFEFCKKGSHKILTINHRLKILRNS